MLYCSNFIHELDCLVKNLPICIFVGTSMNISGEYWPLNDFWVFAFECFNGILGQLLNNNKSIETQMMKRFLSDTEVLHMPIPNEFITFDVSLTPQS